MSHVESTGTGDRVPPARTVRPRLLVRSVGLWLFLVVVAVGNGVAREAFVTPRVGEYAAHLIGTATGIAAFLAVVYAYLSYAPAHTDRELAAVGGLWLGLTVAFDTVGRKS